MADKLEFRSKLSGILEMAIEYDYKLTCEQVEQYFEEDQLTQEQMELVFDYLLAQKVAVKGYTKKGGSIAEVGVNDDLEVLSAEEEAYLKEYLWDLEAIRSVKEGELLSLYEAINQGDSLAKGRLTELYLMKVVEIGKEMNHPEIFLGDLIQEGNVSLMIALETLPLLREVGEVGMEAYLESEIRQGIQMLIEETVDLKGRDQRMVEKVTELDQNITKLTEDLGRKVTIDELALYMELSEEEIMEVMKLTGEESEDTQE